MEQETFPKLPVLFVDTDKNFLNSIDFLLSSRGIINVECCDDSKEVMTRLKSRKYSVILLDLKMQGITGEELLKKIVEEYHDIPVIMLITIDMVEGSVKYLVKTVDTEKLIKTIKKYHGSIDMIKLTKVPYYFGNYIINQRDFFGRKDQLAQIIHYMKDAENGKFWHISVFGYYRIGKSSLLKKVEYEISSNTKSIPVYIDLSVINQDHFTKSIISRIIETLDSKLGENSLEKIKDYIKNKKNDILESIGFDLSIGGLFTLNFNPKEGDHWEAFFNALDKLIKKAKKKDYKSIVLILDEIYAITKWNDFREVLIKLRAYVQESKDINLVVSSAYPLYELSKDDWSPFFNIFEKINLRELTDEEADALIKSPAKGVGIHYSDEAVNLIKMLCGKKPYYIQVLCRKIFEKLFFKERSVKNIIDPSQVEDAVDDALEQLHEHLTQIIEKCTDYQKDLLSSIAEGSSEKTKEFLSDKSKIKEREKLRDRAVLYQTENECTIDGLMKRWFLRE